MSMPKTQPSDNQTIAVAFLGLGGHIYKKARQAMGKSVITGIYAIVNPLGQTYIGRSIDYARRMKSYKTAKAKGQPKLHASITKFGWENHTHKLIISCEEEWLNELEQHHKFLFIEENGWENALFCSIDDDFVRAYTRAVKQWDLKGNLIAEHISITEAVLATGVRNVGCCVCGKQKSAGGFLWSYSEDPAPIPYKRNQTTKQGWENRKASVQKKQGRPIVQLNDQGEVLNEYPSIGEAAAAVAKRTNGGNIWRAIKKNNKAYGYNWAYK
jgi:hypothetical protein